MLSNYNYYCPYCSNMLSKEEGVHFFVENDKKEKANLLLSPLPGVYHYISDNDISIKKGDQIKFSCFTCKEDLRSSTYPGFVNIHLKVTDGVFFDVLFSSICGERLTYVIMEGKLEKYEESFLAFERLQKKAG